MVADAAGTVVLMAEELSSQDIVEQSALQLWSAASVERIIPESA